MRDCAFPRPEGEAQLHIRVRVRFAAARRVIARSRVEARGEVLPGMYPAAPRLTRPWSERGAQSGAATATLPWPSCASAPLGPFLRTRADNPYLARNSNPKAVCRGIEPHGTMK